VPGRPAHPTGVTHEDRPRNRLGCGRERPLPSQPEDLDPVGRVVRARQDDLLEKARCLELETGRPPPASVATTVRHPTARRRRSSSGAPGTALDGTKPGEEFTRETRITS